MGEILDIVLPVFCLIALGYAAARFNYLETSVGEALADFVFKVAVPVLLMRSIATAEFSEANPWPFWGTYFFAVIITWALAAFFIQVIFNRGHRAAVIAGVAAGFSNLVLLGIPLIERAYGTEGLQILFLLISVHLPIMMTVSTFLMEHAVRADGVDQTPLNAQKVAAKVMWNLITNPIIIGIFAGIVWRFSGLGVSQLPAQMMELLARTTGPLALFSLGMSFVKYGVRGNIVPAGILAALSLLAMPAIVYLICTTITSLPPLWVKVVVLAAAAPTGVNAYLFATYFKIGEGLATNTIVLALFGSVITLPFWLFVT